MEGLFFQTVANTLIKWEEIDTLKLFLEKKLNKYHGTVHWT